MPHLSHLKLTQWNLYHKQPRVGDTCNWTFNTKSYCYKEIVLVISYACANQLNFPVYSVEIRCVCVLGFIFYSKIPEVTMSCDSYLSSASPVFIPLYSDCECVARSVCNTESLLNSDQRACAQCLCLFFGHYLRNCVTTRTAM